eukprot:34441-Eustigmatos_ZCMA.PRE.1
MDEPTFVWAMESVLSRAFKGSFGTGTDGFCTLPAVVPLSRRVQELRGDLDTHAVVRGHLSARSGDHSGR